MNQETTPPIGAGWAESSLVWGRKGGQGDAVDLRSPADQSLIQRTALLSPDELARLAAPADAPCPPGRDDLRALTRQLSRALACHSAEFLEAMQYETAFLRRDCEEMLEGTLDYVREFATSLGDEAACPSTPLVYCLPSERRQIRLTACPWGTVAVILPQNAFLLVAVTCLLNALQTGNRVILRAPLGSARSAALLARALALAEPPSEMVSVVLARAKEFVRALCDSASSCLIHYMGSSLHAPQILSQAFQSGKGVLIDGEGNGWVYVGEDADREQAVDVLTTGALRYNGQTCTSVNGAVIHPALYSAVRERLISRWQVLRVGNPLADAVDVGPLFDAAQAEHCERQIQESGGRVLCGGGRAGNCLAPTLVESPSPDSGLVTHGLFGGALWIREGGAEDFISLWSRNRYPLCAGVLSASADPAWWSARLSNLARLTVNGDSTVEHVFEPWGGYPGSGMNTVGRWQDKYQRLVQIDERVEG